jgi:hypothetical protein
MKKTLAFLVIVAVLTGLMVGCAPSSENITPSPDAGISSQPAGNDPKPAEGMGRVGGFTINFGN